MSTESLTKKRFYVILGEIDSLYKTDRLVMFENDADDNEIHSPEKEKLLFSEGVESDVLPKTRWYDDKVLIAAWILTLVWGIVVSDYAVTSGWWESRFEMTPPEFLSYIAGLLSPVGFIWVVAAYFSTHRRYIAEADKLRVYIHEFMHPSAKNKLYVRSLLDDIREQTAALNVVYEKLSECTGGVGEQIGRKTSELATVTQNLEKNVLDASDKIEKKSAELSAVTRSVNAQAEQSAMMLENNLSFIRDAADKARETVGIISASLQKDTAILNETGDKLTDRSVRLSEEIREQSTLLLNASENAKDILTTQTAAVAAELKANAEAIVNAGAEVHKMIGEQSAVMKSDIAKQTDMIVVSAQEARDNMDVLTSGLEDQTTRLFSMSETAKRNTEKMLSELETRMTKLEEVFNRQNEVIVGKDAALTANSEKLQATFKEQNTLLDQEAEKIVGRFRSIETTLDTYVTEINAASSTAIEQISTVSESLDNKAEQIAAAAGRVHGGMASVAEEMEVKAGALNASLSRIKSNAETVSATLDERTALLTKALDEATEKLAVMKDEIQTGMASFDDSILATDEKAETACQKLAKHSGELSDLTSALVSQSIVTETSLAQQQKYISNASAKLEETKANLKQQSDDLINISELLDSRAAQAVLRLARLMEDTLGQASRVTDKMTEIDTALADRITALETSSQRTVLANNALRDELNRHKSLLDSSVQQMTTYTGEVTSEITRQTTQMNIASELIKSRTEKAVLQIDEQFRKLQEDAGTMLDSTTKASAELAAQAEKVETLFSRQNTSLANVSDKLGEQTSLAASMLREQSEQADKDLERLISRIHLIEEGLNVQTKELSNASEMTISQLESVGATLTKQVDNLSALGDAAKAKIVEVSDMLNAKSQELSTTAQNASAQHLANLDKLDKKQGEFKAGADAFIERVEQLSAEIGEQADNLQKQSAKSTQQAVMVRDSMQRHIIDLGDVANVVATQSRLGEASLSNQINYLKDAAEDVMTHIRNINEAVRQNTNDLLTASSRIGFELDAMGENLRRRNEEASKTAEDSLNRSQTAAQFLEEKAKLLSETTERVISGLTEAGGQFDAQTDRMEAASQTAREQLEATGESFLVQSHQVNRIADEAQKAIKNYSVSLRERAVEFNKTAEDANGRVRALNETVGQIGKEFEEMSNKGVIQIDLAGQRLRAMISEVAGNSERIAVEVRKSGEQFVDQSDLLSIAADEALKKLQDLLTLMRDNAHEIQDSGEKISAQSIKLGGAFNRQVQALITASRSAENYIATLDKKKEEADTERFMRDASFIVERLQSLGVDMARLFSPNVEEDLWKRYYSGDRSAFIRHLSRAVDKAQVRKMCDLLTENAEFREYVSRYMGEFEGLLARAQETERSEVLTGVLLGSESGRLYMVLSRVFNKDA